MAALTAEQTKQYYAEQGNAPKPLSPAEWLAKQDGSFTTSPTLNAGDIVDQPAVTVPNGAANTGLATSILDSSISAVPPEVTKANADVQNADAIAKNRATSDALKSDNASIFNRIKGFFEDSPSTADILAAKSAELGIGASIEQIKGILTETDALRTQLNNLNTEEATLVENTIGQGRGIPLAIIDAQQAKIQRQYAIRKNAVAADLGARTALVEALRGNVDQALKIAQTAVTAAIYDQSQKVQDYKDLYAFNKDIIDSLDSDTKSRLKDQYDRAQKDLDLARENKEKVAQLMVDNPAAGITLSDSVETAALKVSKAGGSLAARQETRLGRDTTGLTPTQKNESSAVVSLYSSTVQEAIAAGATPEQAVQAAVALAAGQGTKLDLIQQKALLDVAKTGGTGGTPAAVPTLSPIEQTISSYKKGGILTNADIRETLKKRGFTPQEIAASSVGGVIPSLTAYFFGQ